MRLMIFLLLLAQCKQANPVTPSTTTQRTIISNATKTDPTSWAYFLQHLPEKEGPVLNYKGQPVPDQDKHYSLINFDVGSQDLQQCADALMRLRAEYLFEQNKINNIAFHFVSGQLYRFSDYCQGLRPVPKGQSVQFIKTTATAPTHQQLRQYLNLVYTYASTLSLAKELPNAAGFTIGSVVIHPGSPGHCFIITDEAKSANGKKLYKLVEGYTPAQTMYVLRNNAQPSLGYWHALEPGTIETASYTFTNYQLKKFE